MKEDAESMEKEEDEKEVVNSTRCLAEETTSLAPGPS